MATCPLLLQQFRVFFRFCCHFYPLILHLFLPKLGHHIISSSPAAPKANFWGFFIATQFCGDTVQLLNTVAPCHPTGPVVNVLARRRCVDVGARGGGGCGGVSSQPKYPEENNRKSPK